MTTLNNTEIVATLMFSLGIILYLVDFILMYWAKKQKLRLKHLKIMQHSNFIALTAICFFIGYGLLLDRQIYLLLMIGFALWDLRMIVKYNGYIRIQEMFEEETGCTTFEEINEFFGNK